MKYIKKYYQYALFLFIILCIIFLYTKTLNRIENQKKLNVFLSDSIGKLNAEKHYMQQLISLNFNECNKVIPENLYIFDMNSSDNKDSINFFSLLTTGKRKLIIRYTEIGCNSCTDITFRLIRHNINLLDKYEIIVLVDFTDIKSYIKWAKILEIDEKVFWIKKGNLPFNIENANLSYLFLYGQDTNAYSFFIPNSLFIKYLNEYLTSI